MEAIEGTGDGNLPNETLKVIRKRRSTRSFLPDMVDDPTLKLVIDAGLWAPSGHNQQPWHFSVLRSRERIDELNRRAKGVMAQAPVEWIRECGKREGFDISYGAPVLILVFADKEALMPEVDCSAAIQNMALAAESLGLGSLWLGFTWFAFQDEEYARASEIDGISKADWKLVCGLAIGKKASDVERKGPPRKEGTVRYFD